MTVLVLLVSIPAAAALIFVVTYAAGMAWDRWRERGERESEA